MSTVFQAATTNTITVLRTSLGRLLNIRPGEWKLVLLLQLQIFLIIGVLLIAKPAGSAIFLARFGPDSLPYMYILTAVVAGLISTAYAGALKRFSLLRVNLWSIGICLTSLLAFTLLIPNPFVQDLVAIGLYLWVALFGVLAASQFWMLANLVFDVRQAKRLFGPIGAGAIAGGITGGYVANLVAGAFGIRALLFSAVVALLPVILISIYVLRNYLGGQNSGNQQADIRLKDRPYQIIKGSKHLLLLCGIIILSVITAKLVDYQFSALAVERFADPDRLTSFFGFWFSTFNVVGLLIQLLLTQRIVRWVGISGALFVLPAGLSLGAMVMFLFPGLPAATFSRLVDGSLKQSLHRAGVEMLFLPVDKHVKNRIKIYIDVLIDSVAGGMGGLLLILFTALGFTALGISGLVLVLSIIWLVCVLLVRDEYLDAFRSQLSHLRPRQQPRPLLSRHREVLAGFMQVLEEARLGQSEQQALYVLERTENLEEDRFQAPIKALLASPAAAIRARALRSLALRPGLGLIRKVVPMLNDADDRVKTAALEYLVTHHLEETEELILEQLKHPAAA
ncbi:MAG: Npt1/Npt2 family nucleotide transporter, partial [Bacteroidota bacterium]